MPIILDSQPLRTPWQTLDPFLFCMHHKDDYPSGDARQAPTVSLAGRNIGQDFSGRDGWSMYHGSTVPGFPRHPHRGFETITVMQSGMVDHSDSLGATARFGKGDVQWMTAGRGIEHCEMFPLRHTDAGNPLELFQVWLNLPAKDKMVDPYFTMLWDHTVPRATHTDANGRRTEVSVIAGTYADHTAPKPPPNSWASRPESGVRILSITMEPGAEYTLPAAEPDIQRMLYWYIGNSLELAGQSLAPRTANRLQADAPCPIVNGLDSTQILVLEGRPIGEPKVQYGPFVMNTEGEIRQAFADYRAGKFGRWPWPKSDPVHPRDETRFAIHADGRKERPDMG